MYSEEYYFYIDSSILKGELCPNDSHYYQACDSRMGGMVTNDNLLCENFICVRKGIRLLYLSAGLAEGKCSYTCTNTELMQEGCTEKDITMPSGEKARSTEICDGKCDDWDCEDEGTCNGYTYGFYCRGRWRDIEYVAPRHTCEGKYCVEEE